MDIGSLIRRARHDAQLSQRALARRAATSQPAVARYEGGHAVPTLVTLERILSAAGKRLRLSAVDAAAALTGPVGGLLATRRDEVHEVLDKHGVKGAMIFGSVSRGEDTSESDLDLLVEMPRATARSTKR